MEGDKNPLEAVCNMMIETLERSRTATQSYIDMVEKTMRSFPTANADQVGTFKAYVERQVAANHAFVDRLLRANDFQEAFRIQAEYLQTQLKTAAEDAAQIGAKVGGSFGRPKG